MSTEGDFSGMTLQERHSAWESLQEHKEQQQEKDHEEKNARSQELQDSLPKLNRSAFEQAQQVLPL